MKVADFIKWAESVQEEENRIMLTKGEEYTISNEDKFRNFKSIVKDLLVNHMRKVDKLLYLN